MIEFCARTHSTETAGEIIALGFKTLEISLPFDKGPDEEKFWADFAGSNNISLLAHGPREGNPQDLEKLENEYLPKLAVAFEEAARLQIPILTIHLWLEPRFLDESVIKAKISLLDKIVSMGQSAGVTVCLENLSETATDLAEALAEIPRLALTLDLGHAMLLASESTAPEIIERHFERIRHLHVHDNYGGDKPSDDLHLTPSKGKVPFSRIFGLLKRKGYGHKATLELKPHELDIAKAWTTECWQSS